MKGLGQVGDGEGRLAVAMVDEAMGRALGDLEVQRSRAGLAAGAEVGGKGPDRLVGTDVGDPHRAHRLAACAELPERVGTDVAQERDRELTALGLRRTVLPRTPSDGDL